MDGETDFGSGVDEGVLAFAGFFAVAGAGGGASLAASLEVVLAFEIGSGLVADGAVLAGLVGGATLVVWGSGAVLAETLALDVTALESDLPVDFGAGTEGLSSFTGFAGVAVLTAAALAFAIGLAGVDVLFSATCGRAATLVDLVGGTVVFDLVAGAGAALLFEEEAAAEGLATTDFDFTGEGAARREEVEVTGAALRDPLEAGRAIRGPSCRNYQFFSKLLFL